MNKEEIGERLKSLVCFLAVVGSVKATKETPFGTTADGGFDINSISSFLDDDGTSKIEFPSGSGKGVSFSYPSVPASASNYPYKAQGPPYASYPSAPGSVYSLKPAAAPTPPITAQGPLYVTPAPPYQQPTSVQAQASQQIKTAPANQDQFSVAATHPAQGNYRPPNKNYVLGDPSLKSANVNTQFSEASSISGQHGSYRPPNKNYVLGDPSLNKETSTATASPFFPQSHLGFAGPHIPNFGGNTPHSHLGSRPKFAVGSSTPSYNNPGTFSGQTTGFGSQTAGFTSQAGSLGSQTGSSGNQAVSFGNQVNYNPHQGVGSSSSFTSPGSFNGHSNNPSGQVNSIKYPAHNPSQPGFGASGPGGQVAFGHQVSSGGQVNYGHPGSTGGQINFGHQTKPGVPSNFGFQPSPGGQPSKYAVQANYGGAHPNIPPSYPSNPSKYGSPGFGGFSTNYIIPSANYGSQPGKYGAPARYPVSQPQLSRPGAYGSLNTNYPPAGSNYPVGGSSYPAGGSNYPTGGSNYPTGGSPGVPYYPVRFKGGYAFKDGGAYTKGAYNPGRYRRVPGMYTPPYQKPAALPPASSYSKSPYGVPPPFSIFEDMMLL